MAFLVVLAVDLCPLRSTIFFNVCPFIGKVFPKVGSFTRIVSPHVHPKSGCSLCVIAMFGDVTVCQAKSPGNKYHMSKITELHSLENTALTSELSS